MVVAKGTGEEEGFLGGVDSVHWRREKEATLVDLGEEKGVLFLLKR